MVTKETSQIRSFHPFFPKVIHSLSLGFAQSTKTRALRS